MRTKYIDNFVVDIVRHVNYDQSIITITFEVDCIEIQASKTCDVDFDDDVALQLQIEHNTEVDILTALNFSKNKIKDLIG